MGNCPPKMQYEGVQRKCDNFAAVPPNPDDLQNLIITNNYKCYEFMPDQTEQFLLHNYDLTI